MVIIDYLQPTPRPATRTALREREIVAASRAAKLPAKDLNIPVIMLSSFHAKLEDRADKTPLLSDLRESEPSSRTLTLLHLLTARRCMAKNDYQ